MVTIQSEVVSKHCDEPCGFWHHSLFFHSRQRFTRRMTFAGVRLLVSCFVRLLMIAQLLDSNKVLQWLCGQRAVYATTLEGTWMICFNTDLARSPVWPCKLSPLTATSRPWRRALGVKRAKPRLPADHGSQPPAPACECGAQTTWKSKVSLLRPWLTMDQIRETKSQKVDSLWATEHSLLLS